MMISASHGGPYGMRSLFSTRAAWQKQTTFQDSDERNFFSVVDNAANIKSGLLENCTEVLHVRAGLFYSCPEQGTVLVANKCPEHLGNQATEITCKVEALFAAVYGLRMRSQWYVLLDDDMVLVPSLLEKGLKNFDEGHQKKAFGLNCGATNGLLPCELASMPPGYSFPRCYPGIAVMSSQTFNAIQPRVESSFMTRTSVNSGLAHDTGLGIMIWEAGSEEYGMNAVIRGDAWANCWNETSKTEIRGESCASSHFFSTADELKRDYLFGRTQDAPWLKDAEPGTPACAGTGDFLKIQKNNSLATDYLKKCLQLD
jgi:hypothetical protein